MLRRTNSVGGDYVPILWLPIVQYEVIDRIKKNWEKKPNICHSVIQSNHTAPLEPARKTAKSEIRALGLGDNIHRGSPRVPSAGGAPPVI